MNRRNLIGGAAGIGMAATAVASTLGIIAQAEPASANPDAAFIALAARYAPARAAYNAYKGPDNSPEDRELYEKVFGTWDACMDAQPSTLQGLAAKARMVLECAKDRNGVEMEPDQMEDRMARSIVHDILRIVGGAP